ncbi:MAG: hypothetical protein J3K34DRAFT_457891 [Monoraphidium minutum]|nr:MAG: hypothetical protein J3K34DRAFT_457891 [Monoraphidium minutum]
MSAAAGAAPQPTPAPPQQQQPPYIIAGPAGAGAKRVRLIGAAGGEELADDNPWLHMRLQDGADPQDGAGAANDGGGGADGADEGPMRPEEVVEAFACARGELDWLLALLTRLKEGRHLAVARADRGPAQRVADMAADKGTRVSRRCSALRAAAAALEEGSAALAAAGEREDAFYSQLARLQRYWLLRMPPADSPYSFLVNLGLGPDGTPTPTAAAAAPGAGGAAPGAAAAAAAGGGDEEEGGGGVVPLLKDSSGRVRVQVAPPRRRDEAPSVLVKRRQEPPAVYAGAPAVHALLLRRQQQLMWRSAHELLDSELSALVSGRLQAALQAAGGGAGGAAPRGGAPPPAPGLRHLGALCKAVLARLSGDADAGGDNGGDGSDAPGGGGPGGGAPTAPGGAGGLPPLRLTPRPGEGAALSPGMLLDSVVCESEDAEGPEDDASLASLRPLVLQHIVHTQLKHLLGTFAPGAAAAHAGAAGARAQRLGGGGTRGGGGGGGGGGARPTLVASLGQWIVHGSSRDLVRAEVDRQLAASPGVVPQTFATCAPCTSAIKLLPPPPPPGGGDAGGGGGPQANGGGGGGDGAPRAAPLPALLLLSGSALSIEGAAPAGADPAALLSLEARQAVRSMAELPPALAATLSALGAVGGGTGDGAPAAPPPGTWAAAALGAAMEED